MVYNCYRCGLEKTVRVVMLKATKYFTCFGCSTKFPYSKKDEGLFKTYTNNRVNISHFNKKGTNKLFKVTKQRKQAR